MKIIKKNLKKNEVTLKIDNLEDIWVLSQIVEPGDLIKGKTERKLKIGDDTDRNVKVVRKSVFLVIKAEKIETRENSTNLKVLGVITDGPDEISKGEHHSFNLEEGSVFTIIKEQWLKFQIKKLAEASKAEKVKILLVVFDREEAYFARLKGDGYELLAKITGDVAKKEALHVSKDDFYKEISKKLVDYEKTGLDYILLGSPGFWKENLMKVIPEELKKKIVQATVSNASTRALSELIKRDELQKVLKENHASKEGIIVDKLLKAVSKDEGCYGLDETKEKINSGAVKELLVSHTFLQKSREKNTFKELENLMITVEKMDGNIHIISSTEATKSLDGLSGIAGILRWKIS